MRCDRLASSLPEIAHGEITPKRRVERHINQCLRCQAELSQHRRIRHALRATQRVEATAPRALRRELSRAIAALEESSRLAGEQSKGDASSWVLPVALMTAAGAAGAAGAIVFAARSRRRIAIGASAS